MLAYLNLNPHIGLVSNESPIYSLIAISECLQVLSISLCPSLDIMQTSGLAISPTTTVRECDTLNLLIVELRLRQARTHIR